MSEFLQPIFPTLIWVGQNDNEEIRSKAEKLAYQYRDNATETGTVSEGWDRNTITDDKETKEENGVTSFFHDNFVRNEDWKEVSEFILNYAGTMISSTHNIDGMALGNMWTSIYPQGGYVPEHIHNNVMLSGVYYVKAEEGCGEINFRDPAYISKTMIAPTSNRDVFPGPGTRWTHPPKAGDMIIFPGWLPHFTYKNKSGEDRIIISFNLIFDECGPELGLRPEYNQRQDVEKT